ncbi:MAG: hypothetical protein D6705_03735 [Deltaproteobacteria bacterium]|nr:MAG: hypothetical protein D6705_03735 [Deltaproteobacteria bacterium]
MAVLRRSLMPLVLLAAACATGDGMASKFQDASRDYNRYLRWGDQDRAAAFLPQESQGAFVEQRQALDERLELVEVEVTRMTLDKQRGMATARVDVSWHTDRELVVRKTTLEQTWQWFEGNWILVDERRVAGVPLAGFAEPGAPHPYLPGLDAFRESRHIEADEDAKRPRRARRRDGRERG